MISRYWIFNLDEWYADESVPERRTLYNNNEQAAVRQ